MTIELWEIAIALILLPINVLIFIARRYQYCSLAIGAKVFTGISLIAFIVAAFALGSFAGRYDLRPHQYEWPDNWLEFSGALLMGSTLGAIWMWFISREPEL
ncbi:MAG: hypothetical protein GAK28_02655 [Luteibacter sp.]|uniref:hypothetical protein n=1 Tax=Luteibacter sp. TaxID=1886636 RepID=UPI00138634A9|nr:hypothetical protein [Luteibacter sp.]KAF1006344.1 MAG: hypothetical protein GAK28_02655 [Luteibacter sp.]